MRDRRKRGTRDETEALLTDAALRLLTRDGVLGGLSVREIAKEAGVNHGQIYQYFGTREALLRAAVLRRLNQLLARRRLYWDRPFVQRRMALWRWGREHREVVRLESLLALEGDSKLRVFPYLEKAREAMKRDQEAGNLPPDADTDIYHVITSAAYHGYFLFNETYARELGTTVKDLDERAELAFERMLKGLAASSCCADK
ncbi:hypothetical protein FM21_00025 [Streptomyces mutabilis]|uniref:HTH tetR-type domain-containing protein n=1 Tax=Streptomyces mutabilis TaxID=67332 RepID=A0A086MQG2_9ACTN|nr:hypothetical protein FM21_00025 [Streptomyces mutabilis]